MEVETYFSTIPSSSFGIDPFDTVNKESKQASKETPVILPCSYNKIDCRETLVSFGILSESNDDCSIHKNNTINSASNRNTKLNEPSLLDKGGKKLDSKKQDIKVDGLFNTALDDTCIDDLKNCIKSNELSVNTKNIVPDDHLALPNFTEIANRTPTVKNHYLSVGESPIETEDKKFAFICKLPMETESKFLPVSDKKGDSESVLKLQKSKKRRNNTTSHQQVNTSVLYNLKNSSTSTSTKSMPSDTENKKYVVSSKDQSNGKKVIVTDIDSESEENAFLFEIKIQNMDYLDTHSTKVTKLHEENSCQKHSPKSIGIQSEAKVDVPHINVDHKEKMNCKPVEEFKLTKILSCISINSHVFFSAIIVSFQPDGICLNFPKPRSETNKSSKSHSVLFSDKVVDHLFIYCDKCSDVFISIVTSSAYGKRLRKNLKLDEKSIPSYCNSSGTKNQLKISFLMQNVADDINNFMCSKFSSVKLNMIKHNDALVMLTSSSPVKNSSPKPTSLVYPSIGGIQVKEEDVAYLAVGKRINDTIIDFYLNYIYYKIIPSEFQARTHIFSSFFCKFLMRAFEQKHTNKNWFDVQRSVNKWIKNVDIFSKDFIFVPMNRRNHWYLVVICFLTQLNENNYEEIILESSPIMMEKKESSDKSNSGNSSLKTRRKDYPYLDKGKPCVCFFDSLDKSTTLRADKKVVAQTLKRFLKMLWNSKNPTTSYDWESLLCLKAVCPQQENAVDCGLYLLQYVESFFKNPIPYFGNPMPVLKNWFPKNIIIHKRTYIKKVIFGLREKQPKTVQLEQSCSSDVIALS